MCHGNFIEDEEDPPELSIVAGNNLDGSDYADLIEIDFICLAGKKKV